MIQFNYDDTATGDQFKSTSIPNQGERNMRRQTSCNAEAESTNPASNTNIMCKKHKYGACENRIKQLTVFQARQINGCLIRAPTTFYTDIW